MNNNKTFGSALLVAGTAIGAGMLALPITTGVSGFRLSALVFFVSFSYMLLSLFYLLEATMYCSDPEANIISMARDRLGLVGEIVAGLSFTLLLYSVVSAYVSGGGELITDLFLHLGCTIPNGNIGAVLFIAVFGLLVFFGPRHIDFMNRFLMLGLIITYVVMAVLLAPHITIKHLATVNTKYVWFTIPVIALAFTSHILVPTLRGYLRSDTKELAKALLYGSLVPLVFYFFWNLMLLGNLPVEGINGLGAIARSAHPVAAMADALESSRHLTSIALNVGLFSFFALVTSFLGASISLFDFLADGLKIKKNRSGKLMLTALCFVPPLVFAIFYPQGFVVALGYAGVFVSILYGFLPALMVWHARYVEKAEASFKVPGGKPLLFVLPAGALIIIILQVATTLHYLPVP